MLSLFKTTVDHPRKCKFYGMDKDEEVLLLIRRDLVTNLKWFTVTIVLIISPLYFFPLITALFSDTALVVPYNFKFVVILFWYIFTFGYVFMNYINWFYNVHLVTNKRVVDMDFHGILYRNIADAPLRNIEDVTYTMGGILEVLFGYGNVHIQTAGASKEIDFIGIPNPAAVQDYISDLVATKRK